VTQHDILAGVQWRKSSFSGSGDPGNGDCVELAHLSGARMAIRDSKNPAAGALIVPAGHAMALLAELAN
jgi:hypothetical protein